MARGTFPTDAAFAAGAPRAARSNDGPKGLFGRLLYWAPAGIALGLVYHVVLLGLGPARAEEQRLRQEAEVLQAEITELEREAAELAALLAAQRDPIYMERERRHALDPRSAQRGGQADRARR